MLNMRIRVAAVIACLLSLVIAWAVLIWVALQVSSVVLSTLDMIVELAAISP